MPFVQVSKVSLSFGDRDILKDVSIVLNNGTKAALTGANGAGKSTLMKVIAGLQAYDSGNVSFERDTVVAYLPQSGIVHKGNSLYDEAEKAFAKSKKLIEEMDQVGKALQEEKEEAEQKRLSETFYNLQLKIDESGWHRRESLIKEILTGLGFAQHDFKRLTDEFSGGWQMRIALAKILLQGADILILDEPTNYLDLDARRWLENYLASFKGGFLLVSHDRYFLDSCVTETYELFNAKLTRYAGTYTKYEKQREQELEQILKAYAAQQEEIKKSEELIRRFRYKATKAAMVQERIKRLEKMERIEIPEQFRKIKFNFPQASHSGKIVMKLENISKSFGEKKVIENFDFILEKNERLVLVGKNGAGKSTLLRIMAGFDMDFEGKRELGSNVDIGYFSQDAAEALSTELSVIDLLESEAPLELIPNLRNMLAAFLFRGDDIYKSISVLSGGEKARLSLLRLLLKKHNLLILDEPTNHLDMHSQDALLEAIKNFGGTVIFVSHDQGFIQNLANHVLELSPATEENFLQASTIKNYPGNFEYYLYTTSEDKLYCSNDKKMQKPEVKPNNKNSTKNPNYVEQKELRAKRQKLERQEKKLLEEIDTCEQKMADLQSKFSLPEIYSVAEKSKKLADEIEGVKAKIKELSNTWEEIVERLEEFQ